MRISIFITVLAVVAADDPLAAIAGRLGQLQKASANNPSEGERIVDEIRRHAPLVRNAEVDKIIDAENAYNFRLNIESLWLSIRVRICQLGRFALN